MGEALSTLGREVVRPFAMVMFLPAAVTSIASTFSRSNLSSTLSRRSNVVRLRLVSWNAGIANTFFSSFLFA